MSHDPFDPHTRLGQTSWGTLMRGENERAKAREKMLDEVAANIQRQQTAQQGALPKGPGPLPKAHGMQIPVDPPKSGLKGLLIFAAIVAAIIAFLVLTNLG